MGDEFNFRGANLSNSNNTFKSTLTNVNQFTGGLPTTDATTKQQKDVFGGLWPPDPSGVKVLCLFFAVCSNCSNPVTRRWYSRA